MKVILSLTSFPARIDAAGKVIEKMAAQTVRPDKIVLYLTASQFPDRVPSFESAEVRICDKPIKSYTKLVPALKDFPDDIIITVDDDIDYPDNLIEKLLTAHKKYPRAICANRVRRIKFGVSYGKWPLYRSFRKYYMTRRPHPMNCLMGVGGVLYPPRCLHPLVTRDDIFMKIAPTTDDLWFWAMAAKQGTSIKFVNNNRVKEKPIGGTQEISLMSVNCGAAGGNNKAMANILAEFPELKNLQS